MFESLKVLLIQTFLVYLLFILRIMGHTLGGQTIFLDQRL